MTPLTLSQISFGRPAVVAGIGIGQTMIRHSAPGMAAGIDAVCICEIGGKATGGCWIGSRPCLGHIVADDAGAVGAAGIGMG